jgi:hypothetical protein
VERAEGHFKTKARALAWALQVNAAVTEHGAGDGGAWQRLIQQRTPLNRLLERLTTGLGAPRAISSHAKKSNVPWGLMQLDKLTCCCAIVKLEHLVRIVCCVSQTSLPPVSICPRVSICHNRRMQYYTQICNEQNNNKQSNNKKIQEQTKYDTWSRDRQG